MPPEVLLQMLRQKPFQPFRIHLLDGTVYEIRHPEMVMPGKRWFIVGIVHPDQTASNGQKGLFDIYETVATLHVVRLEPIQATA